jgi:hypothetical protein
VGEYIASLLGLVAAEWVVIVLLLLLLLAHLYHFDTLLVLGGCQRFLCSLGLLGGGLKGELQGG